MLVRSNRTASCVSFYHCEKMMKMRPPKAKNIILKKEKLIEMKEEIGAQLL